MGLPLWAWMINGVVAALGVLAVLYVGCLRFLYEAQLTELLVEAHRLRAQYQERLDAIRRGEVIFTGMKTGIDAAPDGHEA